MRDGVVLVAALSVARFGGREKAEEKDAEDAELSVCQSDYGNTSSTTPFRGKPGKKTHREGTVLSTLDEHHRWLGAFPPLG